jgi:hypothetical protein
VDDDGCSNPFDECSNPFVGSSVVVICWFHSCMHARSMLLPAVQSLDRTHQGHTGQDSGHKFQD